MRDRQLSEDYDSLIFEYCDEYPDVAIKQLVKLIEKTEFRVAFNKKKQIRSPQKNGNEDDRVFQNLEINRRKTRVNPSKNFHGLLFDALNAFFASYTF